MIIMVMIFYHNTSNNDHNNIDNTNDSKNNIRTTIYSTIIVIILYIFIDIHIQIHVHMYILTHYIYICGIVLWIGHFLSRAEVPRPPRIFASRDGALAAASFCSLSGGS